MARIRTIKPEFFTSEDIVGLSPLARLLFIALWCEADRDGRLVWKPKTFKLRYLPADSCDADELCKELLNAGLVVLYGDGLATIPAFSKHQHINPREAVSSLPAPDACQTRELRVVDASPRVPDAQGGREGKGREGEEATPPNGGVVPDKPGTPQCPHAEIVALYHEVLPELPRVRDWGEDRQKFLRTRWREDPKRQRIEWWRKFFEYVRECPFLMGESNPSPGRQPFFADLEWLIRPSNFRKVIEGKYQLRRAA